MCRHNSQPCVNNTRSEGPCKTAIIDSEELARSQQRFFSLLTLSTDGYRPPAIHSKATARVAIGANRCWAGAIEYIGGGL
jgi:hypothetical protein